MRVVMVMCRGLDAYPPSERRGAVVLEPQVRAGSWAAHGAERQREVVLLHCSEQQAATGHSVQVCAVLRAEQREQPEGRQVRGTRRH